MRLMPQKKFVIFSQTFVPDPAAVGQHMADVAAEMARRGHEVLVFASSTGYDDPTRKYPLREHRDGYQIRRLPFSSFGKKSLLHRAAGTASFMGQVLLRGLTTRSVSGILFSTSPPMIGLAATLSQWVKRVPTAYWAMDLNPDQLITLGKIKAASPTAHALEAANRLFLRSTDLVIALDRFMADRIRPRLAGSDEKIAVIPPWSHEQHTEPVEHADNPFRRKHGLEDKFVVMYSGNHSSSNPLDTILAAAEGLRGDDRFRFMFVGGGAEKKKVEQFVVEKKLTNTICLPYQPIEQLRYSLSAADVHVVTLGEKMVGIIHPCKVYGAMSVGRPILYCGPRPSHVSDLLDHHDIGRQVLHGEAEAAVAALRELADLPEQTRREMGQRAREAQQQELAQSRLCGLVCDRIEGTLNLHAAGEPATS